MLQSDWTANSCSGTNPGIAMSPNLPLFRVEVGLRPTSTDFAREK